MESTGLQLRVVVSAVLLFDRKIGQVVTHRAILCILLYSVGSVYSYMFRFDVWRVTEMMKETKAFGTERLLRVMNDYVFCCSLRSVQETEQF